LSYLLDTDILVFYLRGEASVRETLLATPLAELKTSSVCIGELYYGAAKSQKRAERKLEVDHLRGALPSLAPGNAEMERFGVLKASLEAQGQRLADADLIIAATALEHDLTLITGNLGHFGRIPDLKVATWLRR
jgi:tRNA(fMet)-specific endonuclease VapC